MPIHPVDLAILIGYFVGIVLLGVVLSRRAAKNLDSYFLGGRSLPWYFLGISNASGQFDISGTMWMVMLLFVYGMKSIWIPWLWPTFNQVFLMIFLSAWLRRSGALTGADWLKTRFGTGVGLELAHVSVVIFALVNVVGFTAYGFIGIGKFAEIFLQDTWNLEPNTYALILMSIASVYVVLGGMYSVVLADVMQFVLMTISSVAIGIIAMYHVSPEAIAAVTPEGWDSLWFGWNLNLDWSGRVDFANQQIANDGYALFTPFIMMVLFKGILASIAGPAPNYDMQRILATRSSREAALMSGMVSPILYVPRYFLVGGITVLALIFYSQELNAMGDEVDFEKILPLVMHQFVPIGLSGLLLAGLFAAFMSTFDATVNAGAAYLTNDIYKRYFGQGQSSRSLTIMSYVGSLTVVAAGIACGYYVKDIDSIVKWITAGLYGGYIAPNLLKWIWWRLNGIGYFAGMTAGVALALVMAKLDLVLQKCIEIWPQTAPMIDEWSPFLNPVYLFPLLLIVSGGASLLASWLSSPDDQEVLKSFYRQVRPWGFWGPIHRQVVAEDPSFQGNHDFVHDMVNCVVGIVWQIALSSMPVFLVIRNMNAFWIALGVSVVTSMILKFRWYDRLEPATASEAAS